MIYLYFQKRWFSVLSFCFLLSLIFFGCGGGGNDGSASLSGDTGSIAFGVEWNDDSVEGRALAQTGPIDCAEVGVAEVQAEVYDDGGRLLASGGPWDCDLHSGTIDNVPAGSGRKVVVKGMSAEGREYYKGEVSGITVASGQVADAGMIEASAVIYVDGRWLQYRTYPDSSRNRYQGYIEYMKAGKPIETSDISKLVLKDADGNVVQTRAPEVYSSEAYNTTYDAATGTVRLNQLGEYKDFSLYFPENVTLQQGNYTFEATTARGEVVTETVFFPGRVELPTPDTTNFQHEWGADGSLTLSWNNRSGDYDNISVYFGDQDWKDLCYLNLPADVEQVTFPADEIQKLVAFRNPISANVLLRYRAIDEQNMNYARSYANVLQIPWDDVTVDLLDYWPITQGSTWLRTFGDEEFSKSVIEGTEAINGVDAIKSVYYDSDYENMTVPDDYELWTYDDEFLFIHGTVQVGDPPWNDDPIGLSTFDPPHQLKRLLQNGGLFSSESILTTPDGSQYDDSFTWEILGFEDVYVPAGGFSNCLKVKQTESSAVPGFEEYAEEIIWIAKGVGIVQTEEIFPDEGDYSWLVSAEIVGYTENVTLPWAPYLQYRTHANPAQNKFRGLLDLRKNGASILEEDIVKIDLRGSDYTPIPIEKIGHWNDLSYGAGWNANDGRFDFNGPQVGSGFYVDFPNSTDIPEGYYIYEVTTSSGAIATHPFYFPGKQELPVHDAQLMRYEWLPDGRLSLFWTDPSGDYEEVQVTLQKEDESYFFYSGYDSSLGIEEIVIPRWVIESITKLRTPQTALWTMRTRVRSDEGMNFARGYSDVVEIPWIEPPPPAQLEFDWSYLQYRTYADSASNRYQGFIQLQRTDGADVQGSDVSDIALKNSLGSYVEISQYQFYDYDYYAATWNDASQILENLESTTERSFGIRFPSGVEIPMGQYTYEVTTAGGDLIENTFNYPGRVDLPIVQSQDMFYEWQSDGSLYLAWINPPGTYDQVQVGLDDQDFNAMFYTRYMTPDVESIVIPADWIAQLRSTFNPSSSFWRVRTRAVTPDGMNYARGYSDTVSIPWN